MDTQRREDLTWEARRGRAWLDMQVVLDRLFLPLERILIDTAVEDGVGTILDVGCGTGSTTLAFAERLGPHDTCTGLDISDLLLSVARRRAAAKGAANARFIVGDAQRHRLPPQGFDAAASRFGVMFFDDPVAAFANIRSAVRPGGALTCVVWRGRGDNPFMTAAERAAGPLLGWSDQPDPDAPGQFAFADARRVERIVRAAGWGAVEISPLDVPCALPKADLDLYARRMGRVGLILPDLEEALREQVLAAVERGYAAFLLNGVATFDAACWMVRARAG
ncbi:methyltransferase domain-containing protein [Methylobacterium sp. NEAU 140]|uniref:class I SAM-dependent methyltransferase n=1 Tax=Methylobacterium sp. NEAU 140 TaxID=3064945 RepID=UPI0027331A58|nr:class I SAM-dependent methyltransferase [Methylobacterium sp. NEAU 140]MDP4025350.1 methyltransferase domain-containing protein [Methylobacterium sp. NEAU 140]